MLAQRSLPQRCRGRAEPGPHTPFKAGGVVQSCLSSPTPKPQGRATRASPSQKGLVRQMAHTVLNQAGALGVQQRRGLQIHARAPGRLPGLHGPVAWVLGAWLTSPAFQLASTTAPELSRYLCKGLCCAAPCHPALDRIRVIWRSPIQAPNCTNPCLANKCQLSVPRNRSTKTAQSHLCTQVTAPGAREAARSQPSQTRKRGDGQKQRHCPRGLASYLPFPCVAGTAGRISASGDLCRSDRSPLV